ncbi:MULTISPECIES: nuclear transport factor 2 family protein [unclassified Brenneria]|uniref:nuclear transport factor 2 family protein n=1 Tax=unclassified Brenneria TaxID=2634434 RepID=UPI00155451A7|nr:nuclear transport factor 2 family protein [Brenneria sp. hezel4-2-4]MEE3649781.1 nuclear transport factor 2 family protein [Brenneria sp. HEZEL_4_2_4]NPC99740.1 nuclear transport factor 2 family protein [Brenneria sp. hezel4-2-4]
MHIKNVHQRGCRPALLYACYALCLLFPLISSSWAATQAPLTEKAIIARLTPEQRIERAEAVTAIQNVLGRYVFLHTANKHKEAEQLFALKTPGLRVEMMWGVYEGAESIQRLYSGYHVWADTNKQGEYAKGTLHIHTLTTPIVEVAGDLNTAKAVWMSPGVETALMNDELTANWGWMKYGADFIKEDGEWKIWHLHVYSLFFSPFESSWVKQRIDAAGEMPLPKAFQPDRKPTTTWDYRPDRQAVLEPVPPVPYWTFDETTAY